MRTAIDSVAGADAAARTMAARAVAAARLLEESEAAHQLALVLAPFQASQALSIRASAIISSRGIAAQSEAIAALLSETVVGPSLKLTPRQARKGTNGVSTNGVAANVMFY